jgi:hypothetical protein
MGVGGQRHVPAALPPGKTKYPLYKRLGGPKGRPGRVRKIPLLPAFDPRTVQPVASRYTDWAIPAHDLLATEKQKLVYKKEGFVHLVHAKSLKPKDYRAL